MEALCDKKVESRERAIRSQAVHSLFQNGKALATYTDTHYTCDYLIVVLESYVNYKGERELHNVKVDGSGCLLQRCSKGDPVLNQCDLNVLASNQERSYLTACDSPSVGEESSMYDDITPKHNVQGAQKSEMTHLVYENKEFVDKIEQIKREEESQMNRSEPTYCTPRLVDEAKTNDIKIETDDDVPIHSDDSHGHTHASVKSEPGNEKMSIDTDSMGMSDMCFSSGSSSSFYGKEELDGLCLKNETSGDSDGSFIANDINDTNDPSLLDTNGIQSLKSEDDKGGNIINPQTAGTKKTAAKQATKEDVPQCIYTGLNPATVRKTKLAVRRFTEYLTQQNETRVIYKIPPTELNTHIGGFLMSVGKMENGTAYEPDSLTSFHRGINRYLAYNNYGHDIVTSPLFRTSKHILSDRREELKKMGKGTRPNRAKALTLDQEEMLYDSGQMSLNNAEAVHNMLWFHITKEFRFRGLQEVRQLKWGDVELCRDHNGDEFLQLTERTTTTRTEETSNTHLSIPKIWPNLNPARCPIEAYKLFAANRPFKMTGPDSPFFSWNQQQEPYIN